MKMWYVQKLHIPLNTVLLRGKAMPLTKKQIRNIKPEEKIRRYTDGGGLYLEVNPNGGKYWRYAYRFGGKRKNLALGVYPRISLKQAREAHRQAKSLLTQGTDPVALKRQKNCGSNRYFMRHEVLFLQITNLGPIFPGCIANHFIYTVKAARGMRQLSF